MKWLRPVLALVVLAAVLIPTHLCLARALAKGPAPEGPPEVLSRATGALRCSSRPCVMSLRFDKRVGTDTVDPIVNLIALANHANADRVILEISTEGGEVTAGFDLVKAIEGSRAPVTCVVDYKAYSMGFFILQACAERVMTYRSSLMAHEVREQTVNEVTVYADRLQSLADSLRVLSRGFAEHCARRMKVSLPEYLSHVGGAKDWYMDWEQALAAHAVDRVVTAPREVYETYAHPKSR